MVLKKYLDPADLMRVQVFCIHELIEVIMVNKNENLIFAAFQVVALSLKSFNDSFERLVVNLILSLSGNHFLREKSY